MQVPMSEEEFAGLVDRAQAQGIVLRGRDGLIEMMGVRARWAYDGATLTVDVLDKPFFLSTGAVEARLREALR